MINIFSTKIPGQLCQGSGVFSSQALVILRLEIDETESHW